MNPTPSRSIARISSGLLFLLLGSTAAYWWFYKLGPTRRLSDPVWLRNHSEAARWAEGQEDYHRLGRSPDLFFRSDRIGYYGDESWCHWLAERAAHFPSFRVCGCTAHALELMANQDVLASNAWREANRGRSQEQWLQDGFRAFGVTVQLPPSTNDFIPLLRLLGQRSWNSLTHSRPPTNAPGAIPTYAKYNAFRWLRDSGFQPGKFVASNAVAMSDKEVVVGLLAYAQWQGSFPAGNGLGILRFGRDQTDYRDDATTAPSFVGSGFKTGVMAMIAALNIAGAWLIYGRPWRSALASLRIRFGRK